MQSTEKRNKFERMGEYVLICINEKIVTNLEGEESFSYGSIKVKLLASRDTVIQKLIRIKYPDIDSEFAATLNGGEDALSHEEWRATAKLTADEFEEFVGGVLNVW